MAKRQVALTKCPCCFADGAEFLFDENKYVSNLFVARGLAKSRYSLCLNCGTVFAALRPSTEAAQLYYDLFKDGTRDRYPPEPIGRGLAKHLVKILQQQDLLRPNVAMLHVRCDTGALLELMRARIPNAVVHGLEYFEAYVRYVREQGFEVAQLNPGKFEIPFPVKYDLIVSNHQLTHAIDPRLYLDRLCASLNAGGHILFYNEIDHDVCFDPTSESYLHADVISYHQQLFVRESLEALLREARLESEYLGHQRAKMMFLSRRSTLNARNLPVSNEVIARQRTRIAAWQKSLPPRNPIKKTLYWLMRPTTEAQAL